MVGRTPLAELFAREAQAVNRFLAVGRATLHGTRRRSSCRTYRLTVGERDEVRHGIERLLALLRRADDEQTPADAKTVRSLTVGFPEELEELEET